LYYRSQKTESNERKVKILEIANKIYPYNDLVFYELGKAYFELGMDNLSRATIRDSCFLKSAGSFRQSLKINPASYFSHFQLAQTLNYSSSFSSSFEHGEYEEYKKAALLAGQNSQIFYEVGKIFFSQWPQLSTENKKFTLEILRKISGRKDETQIQALLEIWEMNVKDYSVIERILAEDAQVYRRYAKFIGEKSLSLEERQKILAQAEFMEFEQAKKNYNLGQNEFSYYQVKRAFEHFRDSLYLLQGIRFYQNLTRQNLIDVSEFNSLLKSVYLNLAKCQIAEGAKLKEVEKYLSPYLALEDSVSAVSELESYLQKQGLIGEKLDASSGDLDLLSFEIALYFKQSRYREIMEIGDIFERSFVVIPKQKQENYAKVLQMVGDSYQKADSVYEADKFYQRALEIAPDNLETLVKIRENYDRLNENEKIWRVNSDIEKLLSPKEMPLSNLTINKGNDETFSFVLDGRRINLDLSFQESGEGPPPLVSIFFNDRVVWEDYLKDKVFSLNLDSKLGKNSLQVEAVNRGVALAKLIYR
jgi:hypothetical protein